MPGSMEALSNIASPNFDLSVVICAYQQPDTLPFVLRAYLEQRTDAAFEIIVCDDGSSPETFTASFPFIQEASAPIRWVWQQDQGFRVAASTNNALKLARGRYVVLTDGDMVPSRNFLQKHLEAHRVPGRLIAGNRLWRSLSAFRSDFRGDMEDLWCWLESDAAKAGSRMNEFVEAKLRDVALRHGDPWLACWSCNMSVALSDAVRLDEFFHGWGCEDTELAYRLAHEFDLEVLYQDDIVGHHLAEHLGFPGITRRHEDIVAYLRNFCYMVDKWPAMLECIDILILPYALNDDGQTWRATGPMEKQSTVETLATARRWLAERSIYPTEGA